MIIYFISQLIILSVGTMFYIIVCDKTLIIKLAYCRMQRKDLIWTGRPISSSFRVASSDKEKKKRGRGEQVTTRLASMVFAKQVVLEQKGTESKCDQRSLSRIAAQFKLSIAPRFRDWKHRFYSGRLSPTRARRETEKEPIVASSARSRSLNRTGPVTDAESRVASRVLGRNDCARVIMGLNRV